jgi:hypothetical protein
MSRDIAIMLSTTVRYVELDFNELILVKGRASRNMDPNTHYGVCSQHPLLGFSLFASRSIRSRISNPDRDINQWQMPICACLLLSVKVQGYTGLVCPYPCE